MTDRAPVAVGGIAPFTTIDFPGRLAAVVFLQGCPLRCTYCHNPHLIPVRPLSPAQCLPWSQVLDWLETRAGLLDGVVFSGGEPLLQRGTGQAVAAVRARGFAVGLHTSGLYPDRLAALLPALDWVGFDIKAPFDDYASVTGVDVGARVRAALEALLASGIPHELRCTFDPRSLGADAVSRLARELAALGARGLVLQACRGPGRSGTISDEVLAAAAAHLPKVESRTG